MQLYIDMQLTSYIVCMYPYNITNILPLHVAHLPLLSSLFILGLCIPKGTLRYFPTVVHKNLNSLNQLALVSKQPKNYMHWDYDTFITGSQALHMYLEYSYPKLNHDNIIEALMMAIIA